MFLANGAGLVLRHAVQQAGKLVGIASCIEQEAGHLALNGGQGEGINPAHGMRRVFRVFRLRA